MPGPGLASRRRERGMPGPGLASVYCLALLLGVAAAAVTRDVLETEEGSGGISLALGDVSDMETVGEEDNGDVVVLADEPSLAIKEENIDKCSKCLKNSFRYRHDGFCGKCVHHDVIDVREQEKLNDAIKCKKCLKTKFRSRNALFCSDACQTKVELPKPTKPTATDKYKTMMDMEHNEKKDNKKKKLKKDKKQQEREKRRKEKQQRKLEKKNKKFGYAPSTDGWNKMETVQSTPALETSTEDLGVFGQVLRAIIVANTWQ